MAKGEYPSDKADQYMLRFPEGMRDRLKAAADRIGRSMNAEIIARIQDYEATGLTTGESIRTHIERLNRKIEDLSTNRVPSLPEGLFRRVDNAAVRHQRSVHEEIVQVLERTFPPTPTLSEFYDQWIGPLDIARAETREKLLAEANAEAQNHWPERDVKFVIERGSVRLAVSERTKP